MTCYVSMTLWEDGGRASFHLPLSSLRKFFIKKRLLNQTTFPVTQLIYILEKAPNLLWSSRSLQVGTG